MNNIVKILTLFCLFSLAGCELEKKEDLIVGKWHLYKYFIDNTDVTNSCHNSVFCYINDNQEIFIERGEVCGDLNVFLPYKLTYYFDENENLILSDEENFDVDLDYSQLNLDLLTRTELEISRDDSGFKLRYILNKVR